VRPVYSVPDAGKPALNYEKDASQKLAIGSMDGVLGEGNLYGLASRRPRLRHL